jgi:hypothetical protein
MREIRQSGSEGGGAGNSTGSPYPYHSGAPPEPNVEPQSLFYDSNYVIDDNPQMAGLVQSVEATAEAQRKGKQPLGREAILRQEAAEKPMHTKRSPAPSFHAFTRVRKDLYHLYSEFVAAFRVAAETLKSGDRHAAFPIGSFPPHLPFVRAILSTPPAWA